jgi:transposase
MLHAGLDLSRKRVDVCLVSDQGELLGHFPAPADRDSLRGLARRVAAYGLPVRGVVESMNGAPVRARRAGRARVGGADRRRLVS